MTIPNPKLRGLYGRLTSLKKTLPESSSIKESYADDFNAIVRDLATNIQENLDSFLISGSNKYIYVESNMLLSKIEQLVGYLDNTYFVQESIIDISSLYNIISDNDLKQRCSDLLSATAAFDRAINQATQILENRIREKSKLKDEGLVGKKLIDKAINSDPNESVLIISQDKSEHEGIAHICRGIVGAFRNPTHHHLLDHYTREDALRLCGFIDQLLAIIEKATVRD